MITTLLEHGFPASQVAEVVKGPLVAAVESAWAGSYAYEEVAMNVWSRVVLRDWWRQVMRVVVSIVVLAMLSVAGNLQPMPGGHAAEAGSPATVGQPAASPSMQTDAQRLVGRWVRPDGGYILEVREVAKEGSLKAGYFNPRPINVSRAEFTRKDGKLTVFVELRDVNYPGSAYNLRYDPKIDRLIGTYFQATARQTYEIEFIRAR